MILPVDGAMAPAKRLIYKTSAAKGLTKFFVSSKVETHSKNKNKFTRES